MNVWLEKKTKKKTPSLDWKKKKKKKMAQVRTWVRTDPVAARMQNWD